MASQKHMVLGHLIQSDVLGKDTIKELEQCVQDLLPGIAPCWIPGAQVFAMGNRLYPYFSSQNEHEKPTAILVETSAARYRG